jgi:predicted small integral membrane protein
MDVQSLGTYLAWMAWTPATGLFFVLIATGLIILTRLAIRAPETERVGAFGIPTTRGDRFFISLLGSAFIHLAWIALVGTATLFTLAGFEVSRLWGGSLVALLYAAWVFRRV